MTESRIQLTDRLRREGRWDEASRFKDAKVAELRAEGVPRKNAQQSAWEAMAEEYPPLPVDELECDAVDEQEPQAVALDDEEVAALIARTGSHPLDLTRDTLWVYQHVDYPQVGLDQAPGLGAWSLLQWARRNRDRFFEHMLPKAMAAKKDKGGEQGGASSATYDYKSDEHIMQLLKPRLPESIDEIVEENLRDWETVFEPGITREERDGLRLRMQFVASEAEGFGRQDS